MCAVHVIVLCTLDYSSTLLWQARKCRLDVAACHAATYMHVHPRRAAELASHTLFIVQYMCIVHDHTLQTKGYFSIKCEKLFGGGALPLHLAGGMPLGTNYGNSHLLLEPPPPLLEWLATRLHLVDCVASLI